MPQKWLIIFLMPFTLLRLGCSADSAKSTESPINLAPPVHETIQVTSPPDGSSFAKGENIVFKLQKKDDRDIRGLNVYLDDKKVDVRHGEMLPEVSPGEHKLRLAINNKTLDEVNFTVKKLPDESMEYTFKFKFSYLRRPFDNLNYHLFPSACLPREGIQTRLTKQDDSEWKDFLPNIFTMSKEWNALTASWQEGWKKYRHPPCLLNRDKAHANEVFIDFHIKANRNKHLSKPIRINFEYDRASLRLRTRLLIRSISEMREILGIRDSIPRSYRIDFSKKSILILNGVRLAATSAFSGCNIVSIYDNLAAIYEWNNKLYVMTKAVKEEVLYGVGFCFAMLEGFHTILILDYAKDLPVEFIEIP